MAYVLFDWFGFNSFVKLKLSTDLVTSLVESNPLTRRSAAQ